VVSGALLWGYVTATWVGVITNMNPELRWFRETLDSLNAFMAMHSLPKEMRIRLREYSQQPLPTPPNRRPLHLVNRRPPI